MKKATKITIKQLIDELSQFDPKSKVNFGDLELYKIKDMKNQVLFQFHQYPQLDKTNNEIIMNTNKLTSNNPKLNYGNSSLNEILKNN